MGRGGVPRLPAREERTQLLMAFLTRLDGVSQPLPSSCKVSLCSQHGTWTLAFPAQHGSHPFWVSQEHLEFRYCPCIAFSQKPCFSSLRPPASPKGTSKRGQSLVGEHGLRNCTPVPCQQPRLRPEMFRLDTESRRGPQRDRPDCRLFSFLLGGSAGRWGCCQPSALLFPPLPGHDHRVHAGDS